MNLFTDLQETDSLPVILKILSDEKIYRIENPNGKSVAPGNGIRTLVITRNLLEAERGQSITQLDRMMTFCELKKEEWQLIETGPELIRFNRLSSVPSIILFGMIPADIHLHIQTELFRVYHFQSAVILSAPALAELSANPEMRKRMVEPLKEMFQLSK